MLNERMKFLLKVGSLINVQSVWQLKLLKYLYFIIRWMNETECKNEGCLKVKIDKSDFAGFCGRCGKPVFIEFNYEPIPVSIAFDARIDYISNYGVVVKPSYVNSVSLMVS